MKSGKGLPEDPLDREASYVVRLRLKKIEERMLVAYAESHRLRTKEGKPSIGKAVVALARVAFDCYAHHTDRYQAARPVSARSIRQAGLSRVSARWLTRDPDSDGPRYRRG